jgi:CHAT domain-containing protein/Tfp pilus assembly protein PilF
MTHHFLIIVFLTSLLGAIQTGAQNTSRADSLIATLTFLPDDTNKINRYFDIEVELERTNPAKAIHYLYKALDLSRRLEKPAKESVTFEDMGYIYMYRLARYDSAEYCYYESVRIRKATLGERNYDVSHALNGLGMCYNKTAQFDKSEKTFLEALSIIRENRGEENSDFALALSNLAVLYDETGKYEKAEQALLRALEIRKKVLGSAHTYYATSLNNMGAFYYKLGYYERSEEMYLEALDVWKNSVGTEHIDYAKTLNNMANMYKAMSQYDKSISLIQQSAEILKKQLGENHPDYATTVNVLASNYLEKRDFEKALPLFQQVLEIRKSKLGEMHPSYILTLNNIATLYLRSGNYKESEPAYVQVVEKSLQVLGENHPVYPSYLSGLGNCYRITGNYDKAEKANLDNVRLRYQSMLRNFSFMSEREKEMYALSQAEAFGNFYSFVYEVRKAKPHLTGEAYNYTVRNKGLLLRSSTAMRASIMSSGDTALIRIYNDWISLKKEISKLNATEISKRKKDPAILEEEAHRIEKTLVKMSGVFSDFEKSQQISWEKVRASLSKGEAAVEFVRFRQNKDSVLYCAFVITPDCLYPEMIPLFFENDLKQLIGQKEKNNQTFVNRLYGKRKSFSDSLYRLIWKPLEQPLKGVKKVYVSPDGILHKISFLSVSCDGKKVLCDSYSLYTVSSTASITDRPESLPENMNTVIFGGVDYNTDSVKQELWTYLPGTLEEKEIIEKIFNNNKVAVTSYVKKEASETNLKKIFSTKTKPSILHISTHGYFYPNPEDQSENESENENERGVKREVDEIGQLAFRGSGDNFGLWQFVKNRNPLIRSGLALAGANQVWLLPYGGTDDEGVLTALEVTQLDMTGTQLVVLSACETGLGDIKGSEGVYGLQRAFKMAGVKYIIMSLWQVPDKETVVFMETFYKKLLKEKDVRQAFNETQKEMRGKYDPYYWAAFVLIE